MPAIDFTAFGLALDVPARTISREGRSIRLTATQAMLLEWLSDTTEPTLDYCCADLWETVDPQWVRGQWDRLATVMTRLGVAPLHDEAERIDLHHVDGEGCPVAIARHAEPEISAPSDEAVEISRADDLAERAVIAGLEANVAEQAGYISRLETRCAEHERQIDIYRVHIAKLETSLPEAEAEIARLRGALGNQLTLASRAKEAQERADRLEIDLDKALSELDLRRGDNAELMQVKAALAAANDRNAELAARVEETLKARLKAEREQAAREVAVNGNVNAEPARETPVALSPRHVTIPVSEEQYRWLEGTALRNRCSPEHVAARLLIAIRKATADDARRRAA
jgi:uncharacterized coiled-coil protein SlyX